MRVIVAGSRSIVEPSAVEQAIANCGFKITVLVIGDAKGVDKLAEAYATQHKIQYQKYHTNWRLGKGAWRDTNQRMCNNADALVAIHDGRSGGTKDMIARMRIANKQVFVWLTASSNNH